MAMIEQFRSNAASEGQYFNATTSACSPFETSSFVRYVVAIGGEADSVGPVVRR